VKIKAAYPSETLVSAFIITRYQNHVFYKKPPEVRLKKL